MWVRVTKTDIKRGIRVDATRCPVARAVRSARRYRADVEVCQTEGNILWSGDRRTAFTVPARIGAWISAFDSGRSFPSLSQPVRFQVRTS